MWVRLPQDEMGRWQFKKEKKQFSSWKIKKIFMNPDFGKKSFHSTILNSTVIPKNLC